MIPPDNAYGDILHPETESSVVLMASGSTLETEVGKIKWSGTTTNVGNVYAVTLSPVPANLADLTGRPIRITFNADATGAATLNPNTLGAIALKKADGTNKTDFKASGIYTFVYNGTSFMLQGEGGDTLTGNMVAADLALGKTGYSNNPTLQITGTNTNKYKIGDAITNTQLGNPYYLYPTVKLADSLYGWRTVSDGTYAYGQSITAGSKIACVNLATGAHVWTSTYIYNVIRLGGGYLWGCRSGATSIDKINLATGAVISTCTASDGREMQFFDTADGVNFYAYDRSSNVFRKYTLSGTTLTVGTTMDYGSPVFANYGHDPVMFRGGYIVALDDTNRYLKVHTSACVVSFTGTNQIADFDVGTDGYIYAVYSSNLYKYSMTSATPIWTMALPSTISIAGTNGYIFTHVDGTIYVITESQAFIYNTSGTLLASIALPTTGLCRVDANNIVVGGVVNSYKFSKNVIVAS